MSKYNVQKVHLCPRDKISLDFSVFDKCTDIVLRDTRQLMD